MKRALLPVSIAVTAVLAVALLLVGIWLLVSFGRDGRETVAGGRVTGAGAALVSDGDGVSAGPLLRSIGTLTLAARSPDGTPLFLGVAPADDVFGYLDGVPYDVVAEATPDGSVVRPVPGRSAPARPDAQAFWIARGTGTTAEVEWPVGAADPRYVVLNADGSPAVTADLVLGWRSDVVFPLGVGLVVAGGLLLVVGAGLALLLRRRRNAAASERTAEPTAGSTAGSPPAVLPGTPAPPSLPPAPPAAG